MKIKIEESNGKKKYWVNDVPYERLEDIPSEFREYFVDKNNNGIPDQFDDLMDMTSKMAGSNPFNALFDKSKSVEDKKSNSSTTTSSNIDQYLSQDEKSSGIPAIIKVAIGMAVIGLGAWLFIRFNNSDTVPAESSELVTSPEESPNLIVDGTNNSNSELTLVIEDPNESPYHMLGVLYENDKRILSFELPDGENTESSDSSLQVAMNVPEGSNLSERTFRFSIQDEPCRLGDDATADGQVTIGQIEFNKSESSDAGAGQRYQTYQYSFIKNGKCLSFSLFLHSSNAAAFDPPVKEYDESQQIKDIEKILATIK